MLVSDIEEPVVAAAARTPFESARRVFVIEAAETMNDQAANRMLKTLEEPPSFAHLVLLTDRREDVLPTIASRCQQVRFDPPPASAIARALRRRRRRARARLRAAGAAATRPGGAARRRRGRGAARGAPRRSSRRRSTRRAAGSVRGWRCWSRAGGRGARRRASREQRCERARAGAGARSANATSARALERAAAASGASARATLDSALRLVELWLRDVLCVREGAPSWCYAVDRRAELEQPRRAAPAAARCARRSSWSATRA